MSKTLYVTDLDGTLLNKQERIHPDHQPSDRTGNGVHLRNGKIALICIHRYAGIVGKYSGDRIQRSFHSQSRHRGDIIQGKLPSGRDAAGDGRSEPDWHQSPGLFFCGRGGEGIMDRIDGEIPE